MTETERIKQIISYSDRQKQHEILKDIKTV